MRTVEEWCFLLLSAPGAFLSLSFMFGSKWTLGNWMAQCRNETWRLPSIHVSLKSFQIFQQGSRVRKNPRETYGKHVMLAMDDQPLSIFCWLRCLTELKLSVGPQTRRVVGFIQILIWYDLCIWWIMLQTRTFHVLVLWLEYPFQLSSLKLELPETISLAWTTVDAVVKHVKPLFPSFLDPDLPICITCICCFLFGAICGWNPLISEKIECDLTVMSLDWWLITGIDPQFSGLTLKFVNDDTSSTAQGGGGSFKKRKPIGEIGCCESRMAERIHWWTERWLELCFLEWLQWLQWSPHHNCWM